MKQLSALTLSLLFALGAFSAVAQDDDTGAGAGADSAFSVIDKNGDGSIDNEEAKSSGISDSRFDDMDQNGDGEVSRSEYESQSQGGQGQGGDTWQ